MQLPLTEAFLIVMLLIFAVPWAIWRLFRTDRWAPLVVVQIVAGIALGPGALGALIPDLYGQVFRADVIATLQGIAWWAVALFVLFAGVELDLPEAWRHRRETMGTATLAILGPLATGIGAAMLAIYLVPELVGEAAAPWQGVAALAMACTVTALPILVLFLEQLGLLRTPLGQRVLRYASLDDMAVWGLLALILVDLERLGRQVAVLTAWVALAFVLRGVLRRVSVPDRWAISLLWLIGVALAADWAGLHFMVGAFLAGAVIDADRLGVESVERARGAVLLFFMPVFFLSTGLRTSWEAGGWTVLWVAGLLLIAAVAGKLLGVGAAAAWFGWPWRQTWVTGWLLQTKALIMIIFANILLDYRILSASAFTALLAMAVVSTVLTMPMVRLVGGARAPGTAPP